MSDFYTIVKERFSDWNYGHPIVFYGMIRALKPQSVVEVGCYRAFGACWMAQALKENGSGRLTVIDNWSLQEHVERYGDPRTHAEGNMVACGVRDWIEIRDGESTDGLLWPDTVDFCYIDAWHSYQAAKSDFLHADQRGAKVIAFDDTENCVGPRMLVDEMRDSDVARDFDFIDIHSDNGMTILIRKQPRRLITFSQELPLPNPGVDLRPLTLEQQKVHFDEASGITGLDYSKLYSQTEHDLKL